MKSAYELAMGRLEKVSPTLKLSEKKKQEIADIDSLYTAKIAERKVFLEGEILKARQSGNHGEVDSLTRQLSAEILNIEEEREEKKERVRKQD